MIDGRDHPKAASCCSTRGPTTAFTSGRDKWRLTFGRLHRPGVNDPFRALVDERAALHQWQVGGLSIIEEIAAVDKRAVRRSVLDALRVWIEEQGGVWIRLAAFPFPYRSAFNFRLDYDHYDPDDFSSTLDTIAGSESGTSHFVNGAAFASSGDALTRLRGLDVGSHGFWHHTYRTVEENLRNVGRGIETLRSARIEPSGFVAPHGQFNRTLLIALETLGVTHSSEFGLAYDELPFTVGSGAVLQIPIHPICLELFLEAVAASNPARDDAVRWAIDYYRELIRLRYQAGEPVFLYGHPTGRRGRQTNVSAGDPGKRFVVVCDLAHDPQPVPGLVAGSRVGTIFRHAAGRAVGRHSDPVLRPTGGRLSNICEGHAWPSCHWRPKRSHSLPTLWPMRNEKRRAASRRLGSTGRRVSGDASAVGSTGNW